VPTKPGGCNRSHILKALEHPTGLHQAPYRHPSHSSQMAQWKKQNAETRGGIGRECREPRNYYNSIHATLTEQWTHCKHMGRQHTKNTAGQCQPQDSHDHMTVANATERTKRLTNANRRPRHYQMPTKNTTDQTGWPDHKLCKISLNYIKRYRMHQTLNKR